MTHDFSHLSDSQLTSEVYKRRAQINKLAESLPQLYVQRRNAKAVFRDDANAFYGAGETSEFYKHYAQPTWHDMYTQARVAANADNALDTAREKLAELTELQTAQKRELKQRQSKRQEAKKAVIQSYLARQKRLAERGTVNPNKLTSDKLGNVLTRLFNAIKSA